MASDTTFSLAVGSDDSTTTSLVGEGIGLGVEMPNFEDDKALEGELLSCTKQYKC